MTAATKCECGAPADDISFDRSICACGRMHYYCRQCGAQADGCDDAPEPAAAPMGLTRRQWRLFRKTPCNTCGEFFCRARRANPALAEWMIDRGLFGYGKPKEVSRG